MCVGSVPLRTAPIATLGARLCRSCQENTAMDLKESCPSVSIPSSDEHREKKKRFTVSAKESELQCCCLLLLLALGFSAAGSGLAAARPEEL